MIVHNSEILFVEICQIHEIEWKRSEKQHLSALGIAERYHESKRRRFRKLRIDHPKLKKEFLLSLAVKTCKDTRGSDGIVPSALAFGEFPLLRLFLGPKVPRATLAERAKAAPTARKLMAEARENQD